MTPESGNERAPTLRVSRIERGLIVAFICLIPVNWPPLPRNGQWADLAVLALVGYVVATARWPGWTFRPVDSLVALYLVASLVAAARAADTHAALVTLAKDVYLAAIYGLFTALARRNGVLALTVRTFALAASGVAALAILAVLVYRVAGLPLRPLGVPMVLPVLGPVFRPRAMLPTPELLGDYLTFSLPLLLGLAQQARGPARRWWAIAILTSLAAGALTVSHSLAGLLVAILAFMWPTPGTAWRRLLRPALLVASLGAVIGINAISVVAIRAVRYEAGTAPEIPAPAYHYAYRAAGAGASTVTVVVAYDLMSYYLLKKVAVEAFLSQPLMGVGLGGFHEAADRAGKDGEIQAIYRRADPHSTLLGRLAETGVVGGLTLAGLWAGFLVRGSRVGRSAWIGRAVSAGLLGLLVNSVNVDIMHFRFVWLGFAMLRSLSPASRTPDDAV